MTQEENQKNIQRGLIGLILVMALMIPVVIYLNHRQEETVQPMTQEQVEQPAEVQKAASKAGTKLDEQQAKVVSREIVKYIETNAEPEYSVNTTKATYKKAAQSAQEAAGADFSITVEKDQGKLEKASSEAPVVLNQYNVKAYKKILRTLDYTPQEKQVGFTISRKITNDGQYLGVGVGYDIDDQKVVAKISYSW